MRFSPQIEAWLGAGHGACWLRTPAIRSFLAATLHHRDRDRYALHALVTMPNHAHVLVSMHPDARLEDEVGAWKSVSARASNRQLGRRGLFWQEDYFDRLVRDARHFSNCLSMRCREKVPRLRTVRQATTALSPTGRHRTVSACR